MPGSPVAAALMIVIGIALLMSLVGLSPALGTFLAGVVLVVFYLKKTKAARVDDTRSGANVGG